MSKFSYRSSAQRRRNLKYGGYQTITTLIVLAALVLVNVLFGMLNINVDMTSEDIYTPGEKTLEILNELEDNIHIYGFYNQGTETNTTNARVIKLTQEYADLSDKVTFTRIDPLNNPTFADQFLSADVESIDNGSLVVQNETTKKYKIVTLSQMYETSTDSSTYSTTITGFSAEEAITSAIQYVTLAQTPVIYELQGHSETLLPSGFQDYLSASNFDITTMNLVTEGITELEGDNYTIIVINKPKTDLSESEYDTLLNFVQTGGKILFLASYDTPELPYFQKLLAYYGLGYETGVMIETDTSHYYTNPVCLIPELSETSDITSDMYDDTNSYVIMTLAAAVTTSEDISVHYTVDKFVTTSDSAVIKGENNQAATYEEGDTKGPFDLAVMVEEGISKGNSIVYGRICVIGNSDFIDTDSGMYVTTGNYRLVASVLDKMQDSSNSLYISTKSIEEGTISTTTTNFLVGILVFVILIPAALIITGVVIGSRRKHL